MDATSMMWTSMLERRTKKHHGSAPLRTPRLRRRALNAYDLESVPASRHTADATENDSYEKAFKPKRSPGFVYVKHLAVFAFCLLLLISVTQQYNSLVRRSLRFAVAVSRRDPRSRHSPGSIRLPIPFPGADAGFELPPRSIPSPPTPFDDLVLDNPSGLGSARRIHEQDVDWYEEKREELLEAMDYKPDGLDETYLDNEDFYGPQQTCQRTNWRARWYHNCNTFHEQSLTRQHDGNLQSFDVTFRGSGSFRYSWLFRQGDEQEQMILKAVRWYNPFDYKYFAGMNNEALVMERLTGSPRIVDIYGHCGLSIMAENMVEEVTKDIVPGSEINWARYGYMKQEKLDALQQFDVHPINNLTNEEKLNLAIVMAESIADIHGYSGGVIVHVSNKEQLWAVSRFATILTLSFSSSLTGRHTPGTMAEKCQRPNQVERLQQWRNTQL